MEAIWLVIRIQVGTVEPDSRPESESSGASEERNGDDASYGASRTGAVRSSRAAAVELATAVLWPGSASSSRCTTDVGAGRSISAVMMVRSLV